MHPSSLTDAQLASKIRKSAGELNKWRLEANKRKMRIILYDGRCLDHELAIIEISKYVKL